MSKTLQFFFNPKEKEGHFESFVYVPSAKEEANLGELYVAAYLSGHYHNQKEIVRNIAGVIKEEFFARSDIPRGEAFRNSLKKADGFLRKELDDKPDILEHFSVAVLSLGLDLYLDFSKIGDLEIVLLRKGNFFDIGKDLETNYSSMEHIFPSVVGGKLEYGDQIFVFTKPLFERFLGEKILRQMRYIKNARQLKKLLKQRREFVKKMSGLLLYVFARKKKTRIFFNIPNIKIPYLSIFDRFPAASPPLRKKIKKSLIEILFLILILLIGYLLF